MAFLCTDIHVQYTCTGVHLGRRGQVYSHSQISPAWRLPLVIFPANVNCFQIKNSPLILLQSFWECTRIQFQSQNSNFLGGACPRPPQCTQGFTPLFFMNFYSPSSLPLDQVLNKGLVYTCTYFYSIYMCKCLCPWLLILLGTPLQVAVVVCYIHTCTCT